MKIVTSGWPYIDIDAYAGIVAYAELLQQQGTESAAISTAPWNESISNTVRSWNAPLGNEYLPSLTDTFVVIDLSDPNYFDTFVELERVDEVIDHHPGFEQYWKEKIGSRSHIEPLGSACTQVYELWQASGLMGDMSQLSARLLICGILDNTLNFGAKITTERDRIAYAELLKKADLPADWTAQYFSECQHTSIEYVDRTLRNDTKCLNFKTFPEPVYVGQLIVWDAAEALGGYEHHFRDILSDMGPLWYMNLISIGNGRSYFLADNIEVKQWLSELLKVNFIGSIAIADRMWLRKEMMKQDIEKQMSNF